ncbi:MAG: hypothetical protein RLZZ385_1675 [Pseudomonadota bacterium]|jgi:cytidine deaminase
MIDHLIDQARQAIRHSYAPYSRFVVGASVQCDDGQIFTGVNVENASYGLTQCAERNAICTAIAHGARSLRTIVIYTPTATPTAPCGACRQVIREFSDNARIISVCDGPGRLDSSIDELLPASFSLPDTEDE